jgi:hypothetical protein
MKGAAVSVGVRAQRLHNQYITRPGRRRPADLVAWLGAVQAQEYPAAKWALALRMANGVTDAQIERAFDEGRILRTHVMRPTWHFVTPSDIRWMLELTAPRVHRAMSSYNRALGLDGATLARGARLFERALGEGRSLTRAELGAHLARAGLPAQGPRLAHLAMHAELEGVICSGPRRGRQFTYALLAERAPGAARLSRDEALAELARRFLRSHGPATIRDFVWWSGLVTADARRGIEANRARSQPIDGLTYWTLRGAPDAGEPPDSVHLLPIYDEYIVAYRDRGAVSHGQTTIRLQGGGQVTFQHALVIGGRVTGTWRTRQQKPAIVVDVSPLRRLTGPERGALAVEAERYGRFLDAPVALSIG